MKVKFDAIRPAPTQQDLAEARQRTRERLERQSRATALRREQLLDVARALIDSHGVEGFNMRHMAQRAGYTAGALYAYFSGKEVILAALRQRVLDSLGDAVLSARVPKLVKGVRGSSTSGDSETAMPVVSAVQTLFMTQSLAWWRFLAREPESLQLLLRFFPSPPQAVAGELASGLQEESAGLSHLEETLAPCRESLLAMGLSEPLAFLLHRELLACGLGLLVLASASGHTQVAGLETQWRGVLQRWLQHAVQPSIVVAGLPGVAPDTQGDLFTG